MLEGLQMDVPLLVSTLLEHAERYHADIEVVARTIEGEVVRTSYAETGRRARRLAQALDRLGLARGERVGTLAWNTQRHLEMFYGVSGSGRVLHTINPRLFAKQLVYIINHAEDRALFLDAATLPLVEQLAPALRTVEHYVLMAPRERMPATTRLPGLLCQDELLAAEDGDYAWPSFDERSACSICYTSGTTGNPKGVVYSHRSSTLSTMLVHGFLGIGSRNGEQHVIMPLAPMFHANAWHLPYVAPMVGARLVLPGRNYEPDRLYELIEAEGVTLAGGVPSMWIILTDWLDQTGRRLSRLRTAVSSGSAPSRALMEKLAGHGVELMQAWGMTEVVAGSTATMAPGTADLPPAERIDRRMRSGRAQCGVRYRIVDAEERELPQDGVAVGHLRVKAPWAARAYFKGEGGSAVDADGWLKTGDVASIDPAGHLVLMDRSKDVIKSGGEWISSIELENLACGHPAVQLAAVIGVAHPKWQERPLLVVVRRPGASVTGAELVEFLSDKVARWWLPDDVAFVDALPMTATGKVSKLALRERFRDHVLPDAARRQA